jgi:hypothetical protein
MVGYGPSQRQFQWKLLFQISKSMNKIFSAQWETKIYPQKKQCNNALHKMKCSCFILSFPMIPNCHKKKNLNQNLCPFLHSIMRSKWRRNSKKLSAPWASPWLGAYLAKPPQSWGVNLHKTYIHRRLKRGMALIHLLLESAMDLKPTTLMSRCKILPLF